jgi:uncharacterized protein (DUF2062 family)
MFKRRAQRSYLDRVRDFIWPQSGWRRALAYISHRVKRLPGTPQCIAAGVACGVAASFTPLIGLHFILAALLAWLTGGSIIASAIGTVAGNPWTFPFIWIGIYRLGSFILGWDVSEALPEGLTLTYIFDNPAAVLVPMIVGAVPAALVAWTVAYWPVLRIVTKYQELRRHRMVKRLARDEGARGRRRKVRPAAGKDGKA